MDLSDSTFDSKKVERKYMVSSINSNLSAGLQSINQMHQRRNMQPISDEDKQQIKSILSQYDPSTISTSDAQSIFQSFRSSGITPGAGMLETIQDAGFDPDTLRQLATPADSLGMEGLSFADSGSGINLSALKTLQSILSQYDISNLSSDQEDSLFSELMDTSMIDPAQNRGAMAMVGPPGPGMISELTDDQLEQIQSILSDYDPSSITEKDAKAIFQAFHDAGIEPGKGMKEAIEAAGFDAEELRTLGMPDDQPKMDEISSTNSQIGFNLSSLQSLQSILTQYDLNNLSNDQEKSLFSSLLTAGLLTPGSMVDMKS
jgi:hypothetical protein